MVRKSNQRFKKFTLHLSSNNCLRFPSEKQNFNRLLLRNRGQQDGGNKDDLVIYPTIILDSDSGVFGSFNPGLYLFYKTDNKTLSASSL